MLLSSPEARLQESANLQRGGQEGRGLGGRQVICSGLSIPLSKEQLCLTRCLHRRHLSLSSWWCHFKNKSLSSASLPTHSYCRAAFNHQLYLCFLLFPWENCILLKPSSPFLELQVPVGLSKMEKTSSLLLFHQRAVKRSLLGALLLSPQKMAVELRLRADASAGTLGKAK